MFKHYLITRFNLRHPNWKSTKNNESLLNDAWMTHRMELFSNFCLPSVAAQTNKNFKWIIFFDITTTPAFKEQILNLLKPYKHFIPLFIDGMDQFSPEIINYIDEDAKNVDYIISSRIDNDDCIHKNYINEIQLKFNYQDFLAIDVIKGYSLQISPNFYLGEKMHLFNPFISLIESKKNYKTVFQGTHANWKTERRMMRISDKPLWLSIIHDKNKVNEFDGYNHVEWKDIKSDFVLSETMDTKIENNITPFKEWRFLSFKNKIHGNFVLLSKLMKIKIGLYNLKK
ncbi:glycosyltransferase [Aestuariibaculum lutulentum]|uniref:Rhamnosyl transferase n=1 Tax=Aestuariibaculum lutulentum TaxID=2920935 RepID=A0ABS9RFQ5_9FLAO|nr:glycosyltransferase [Aestuariibaculum lutulentum]MCH4551029.1 putative rhamnosyl transferase [Aestuariibaculum lutulentum]